METDRLLGSDHTPEVIQPSQRSCSRSRCRVVVEPILLLACFFGQPLDTIVQEFLLQYYEGQGQRTINGTIITDVNTTDQCGHEQVSSEFSPQAAASQFKMYLSIINVVPSMVATLFLASCSDTFGRKFAIIPPLIGVMLRAGILALVIATKWSIYLLFVGEIFQGITGGFVALLSGCMAYVVDTTSQEDRMFRITVVELISFMTVAISLLGLGYIIKFLGFVVPCVISCAGHVLVIIYAITCVPETIQRDSTVEFNLLQHIRRPFRTFWKDENNKIQWRLQLLLLVICLAMFAYHGYAIQTLFALHYPLCWDSVTLGYYQATSIGVVTLGAIILVKTLKFCIPDTAIAFIGGVSATLATAFNAFCTTLFMMYMVPFIAIMAGGFVPGIRAIMTTYVDSKSQGALFSGIGFTETFAVQCGFIAWSGMYAATEAWWAGFAYLAVSSSYLLATLVLGIFVIINRQLNMRELTAAANAT